MARVKKIKKDGQTVYPVTVSDAVFMPDSGKTVTEGFNDLAHKVGDVDSKSKTIDWSEHTITRGGIKSSNGLFDNNTSSSTFRCVRTFIPVEGYDKVLFRGIVLPKNSKFLVGYSFYTEEDENTAFGYKRYNLAADSSNEGADLSLDIPEGAKYFRFTYLIDDADNRYCKVVNGKDVATSLKDLSNDIKNTNDRIDNVDLIIDAVEEGIDDKINSVRSLIIGEETINFNEPLNENSQFFVDGIFFWTTSGKWSSQGVEPNRYGSYVYLVPANCKVTITASSSEAAYYMLSDLEGIEVGGTPHKINETFAVGTVSATTTAEVPVVDYDYYLVVRRYNNSGVNYSPSAMSINGEFKKGTNKIDDNTARIKKLEDGIDTTGAIKKNIGELIVETNDFTFTLSKGAVVGSTGANAPSDNYKRTDYIEVRGYDRVKFLGLISNFSSLTFGYSFYDENKIYLEGKRMNVVTKQEDDYIAKEYLLDIPKDAVFFRTCIHNSLADGLFVRGINGKSITERLDIIEEGADEPRVKFEFSHELLSATEIASIIEGLDPSTKRVDGKTINDIMWQLYDKFDALMERYPELVTKTELVGNGFIKYDIDDLVEKDGVLYRCLAKCDDTSWNDDNFTVASDIVDARRVTHKYYGYPKYARLNGVAQEDYNFPCPNYNTYVYKIASANKYVGNKEGGTFPKKKLLIIGSTHGIEIAGAMNAYILACTICEPKEFDVFALHQAYDVYIIPVLNGYGSYARTRVNANKVDINRNMPVSGWSMSGEGTSTFTGYAAASEFESNLVIALCNTIKFDITIDHHNYWSDLPKQYYTDVANPKLLPVTYQSITDISYALIKAYPQYFGTTPKMLLEDVESAPGVLGKSGGTFDIWWYQNGIKVGATIEICNCIAYNNGVPIRDGDKGIDVYGADFFSTAHYSLLNQLCRFAEYDLKNH